MIKVKVNIILFPFIMIVWISAYIQIYIVSSLYPTVCGKVPISRMVCLTPVGFICDLERMWAATSRKKQEDYPVGEIILSDTRRTITEDEYRRQLKRVIKTYSYTDDPFKPWPHNVVVYDIEEDFNPYEIGAIEGAMQDIADVSCITFRPKKNKWEHAVVIKKDYERDNVCESTLGYRKKQKILLGSRCFGQQGLLVHEFLHTLGFDHTHNSHDRDDFVTIHMENVRDDEKRYLQKNNEDVLSNFGLPYDYRSLMHYSNKGHSRNGEDTIVPKQVDQLKLMPKMSDNDILKLNLMYCNDNIF